jgi:hypothetical protein
MTQDTPRCKCLRVLVVGGEEALLFEPEYTTAS